MIKDTRTGAEPHIPTNRSFGLVFVVFFAIVGLWPLPWGDPVRVWALAASGATLVCALVWPSLLQGPNRLWMRFGALLHTITSPIVLGIIFYVLILPVGVVRRWFGADPLSLRRDASRTSYWEPREPPGPPPESMNDQF
jgi:hypothetical protein